MTTTTLIICGVAVCAVWAWFEFRREPSLSEKVQRALEDAHAKEDDEAVKRAKAVRDAQRNH